MELEKEVELASNDERIREYQIQMEELNSQLAKAKSQQNAMAGELIVVNKEKSEYEQALDDLSRQYDILGKGEK